MEIKNIGEIKVIEICGAGENISDETKIIFLSKSGTNIISEFEPKINKNNFDEKLRKLQDDYINRLNLYFNKNNKPILTAKTDKTTITICKTINSCFRGTTYIKDSSNGVTMISATGRIGEHTELIATIPTNGYVIVYSGGRYQKGWTCFKNVAGTLKQYDFYNEGKYCSCPDIEDAKIVFGIIEF